MARLLLIDDDIAEISAVKRVLSRLGHAPLLATSGSDALASTAQARPDLLIVGATCQGGEALRVVRFLDGDAATAGIPLILLGTDGSAPERAIQLPRPVDPMSLTEQVKALLSGTATGTATTPAPAATAAAPPPFERRTDPFDLPGPLERRAAPSDPGNARRAAADALLARARQLRSAGAGPAAAEPPQPAAAEAAAGLDALFELAPPTGVTSVPEPIAETPFDLPDAPPLDLDFEGRPEAPRTDADQPVEVSGSVEEPGLGDPAEAAVAEAEADAARDAHEAQLRAAAEEAAARAVAEAEARSRAEMEQLQAKLRSQFIAEASRRTEAESAVARLTAEAARFEQERAALAAAAAEAVRAAAEAKARAAALERAAGERAEAESAARIEAAAAAQARVSFDDLPPVDRAQEAARQRALSFRQPSDGAGGLPPPAAPPSTAGAGAPPAAAAEPWPLPASSPVPAELRSGHLEELPLPRLLALALRARASGRLDFSGDFTRSLWFEDGRVVGATSNVAGERVDEVALRLGLLTREQHRQVAAAAAHLASRRAALLLVDRGYVKPAELTGLVRARTEEVVYGLFGESGARFRWAGEPVPADERIGLSRPPLALAIEGVRRRWQAPRADAILGGPATLLSPVSDPPSPADLGLQPAEQRALAQADGLRTLDEVLAGSPLDPLSTRQLLAALVLVGALSVRVVQAGRPAAVVHAGIELARVKEKLEQVRRADYFTILGLGRVATPYEVREAAERLTAEFQPERYQGALDEGLAGRLEEIRRVVADAREVLSDERLRAEYVSGLGG